MTFAGFQGEVPVVSVSQTTTPVALHTSDLAASERAKYEGVWRDIPTYGDLSPGLESVDSFLEIVKPELGSSIVDIGCGTGVAGLKLAEKHFQVSYLDITPEGLDIAVPRKRFIERALWQPPKLGEYWEYGFCCDLMEHLPPEFTMLSVFQMTRCCRTIFFQISLVPDEFGKAIGQPLHLTVQDFKWWRDHLAALGQLRDARDLGMKATYILDRNSWAKQ